MGEWVEQQINTQTDEWRQYTWMDWIDGQNNTQKDIWINGWVEQYIEKMDKWMDGLVVRPHYSSQQLEVPI